MVVRDSGGAGKKVKVSVYVMLAEQLSVEASTRALSAVDKAGH